MKKGNKNPPIWTQKYLGLKGCFIAYKVYGRLRFDYIQDVVPTDDRKSVIVYLKVEDHRLYLTSESVLDMWVYDNFPEIRDRYILNKDFLEFVGNYLTC